MSKRIVVLGAGLVGSVIAKDLSSTFEVTAVDINGEALKNLEKCAKLAPKEVSYELKGKLDTVSVLYVVGGIPCMIAFFLILFSLVQACDSVNTYIPA